MLIKDRDITSYQIVVNKTNTNFKSDIRVKLSHNRQNLKKTQKVGLCYCSVILLTLL